MGLSLLGCAISQTPYQPYSVKGLLQGGYREEQISPQCYRISFVPNGHTPNEKAEDYTLLRAAERTQESGYKYFEVVTWDKGTLHKRTPTAIGYNAVVGVVPTGGNVITYAVSEMTIEFKKSLENDRAYDASLVEKKIREKYRLKPY